jgi:hypothetical protein
MGKASLAALLALLVVGTSVGATAGYYLGHRGRADNVLEREFAVELQPKQLGRYHLYLPVPVDAKGNPPPGLALGTDAGQARIGLVRTEFGTALSVEGEGPLRLHQRGPMPLRLSLDDAHFSYRQFKFWAYLDEGSPAVAVNVTLRERNVSATWDRFTELGRAIVVDETVYPNGWGVLKATQRFDLLAGPGYGDDFPRLVLAGLDIALAAAYVPLAIVVARHWRRRKAGGPAMP